MGGDTRGADRGPLRRDVDAVPLNHALDPAVLFVHGMGRTPLSGWTLIRRLRRGGLRTSTFTYFVSIEDVESIVNRLVAALTDLARRGDYVVVGHSLGGVLLRAALARLDEGVPLPRSLFLLGSPVRRARLACMLVRNPVFRVLAGDCGQLLASEDRMKRLGEAPAVPAIGVAGVVGVARRIGPLGGEPNDGIVTLSEVSADWLSEQVQLPVAHVLLPASPSVARFILGRIRSA
jgi:pimeloyl-ACP methyl ester carboxylesterase